MKRGCPCTALKWRLMENNHFHEQTNRMVLRMVSGFVCVFYVCTFAFEEEGGCFVSLDLRCELASLSRLVFVLHEAFGEGDYTWCLGFRKDEEPHIYEGGQFYKGSIFSGFEERKKTLSFLRFLVLFLVGVVCISVLDRLQYLVALEGRMLESVDGCNFMKDKLFPLLLTSFSLMQLNTRCRSL